MRSADPSTDPTRVAFAAEFVARLERLVAELGAARERGEGAGRGRGAGGGDEFVGHRAYRVGEDLRDFDWELYARLERPFVRVRRREVGERWAVLLDTSASMGLGTPGKLQLAAEVATGIAFAGVRAGATTTAFACGGASVEVATARKRADLRPWLEFLRGRRAEHARSLGELAADPRLAGAKRVFALGDLLDVAPPDLLALATRGRTVSAVRVLAPHELAPRASVGVEWLDRETGERLELALGERSVGAYERELGAELERWRGAFARRGQRVGCWSSASAFEDVVRAALA